MPRRSAEALITAAFLPKLEPIPPPRTLQPARARQVWKLITESRPPGFFLPTDTPLLARFCALAARAEAIEQLMAAAPIEAPDQPRLERRLVSITGAMASLSQKLRLNPANRIERHAALRDETRTWRDGTARNDDRLLGGHAVHGR